MRWDDYKCLSVEKQKEYDFKFPRNENGIVVFAPQMSLIFIGVIYHFAFILVFTLFLLEKGLMINPELKELAITGLSHSAIIGNKIVLGVIILFLLNLVSIIWNYIVEQRWIKKNVRKK